MGIEVIYVKLFKLKLGSYELMCFLNLIYLKILFTLSWDLQSSVLFLLSNGIRCLISIIK